MSETRDCGLLTILNGRKNIVKLAVMEAPSVTPSFLCFLPEFQCAPANILYINGITETTGIQHVSGKAVSLPPLQNNKILLETTDLTSRLSNASLEAKPCFSNGFAQSKSCLDDDICAVEIAERGAVCGSPEMATGTDGYLTPTGIMEKWAHREPHDRETVTDSEISGNRESGNDQAAECNGNHVLIEDLTGETDVLAFEITEFFDAFRDGQEHKLLKFTKTSDLLLRESYLEPEADQWVVRLNPAITNQHLKSDKEATSVDVDRIDGRRSSSASCSGKWNGLLDGDFCSGTFSGPLTFSGPISFSGNSGHGVYSGSVSHRSDSSTASTHSFAFPILPYEWNSSPVKMAQPDKRFIQRPWKRRLRRLFCCDSFK